MPQPLAPSMNLSRTLLLGPPTRSTGCPGVDLSPFVFPTATSGGACGEMAARRQGVDYNCEQQGLFIPFILPDMLSLLKANVGKSSVSLKLSLNLVTGAVNAVCAVAGGDELLLLWSVGRPCANCLQAPPQPRAFI